jgi:hypothetical protein
VISRVKGSQGPIKSPSFSRQSRSGKIAGAETMKLPELSKDERRTLREVGIFHPHPRTRMRAQGILRLSQGLTLQQTADEFMVHLNSVEQWRQRWNKLGLAGLYEGRHAGDAFARESDRICSDMASRRRAIVGECTEPNSADDQFSWCCRQYLCPASASCIQRRFFRASIWTQRFTVSTHWKRYVTRPAGADASFWYTARV